MNLKKLIVLAVVLAFAGRAEATLLNWSEDSLTLSVNDTTMVQLIADDDEDYIPKWVGNNPSFPVVAEIESIVALPAAGPDAIVYDPPMTGFPGWWAVDASDFDVPPSDIASGAQFNVTIKGLAIGTYEFYSDFYETNDVLEITVVPEPTTIVLIALGGLMLRKRRA